MPPILPGQVLKPGARLIHGGGINSQLPHAYFNAQDPSKYGFRKTEKSYHRSIACMSINGCTNREIAVALGVSEITVGQILRQPSVQSAMINMQRELGMDELSKVIRGEGTAAIGRIVERAKNAQVDVTVRQRDDHYLVNRYLGKPKETVETSTKAVVQLTDDELTQIVLQQQQQQALEVEVESSVENENQPLTKENISQESQESQEIGPDAPLSEVFQ